MYSFSASAIYFLENEAQPEYFQVLLLHYGGLTVSLATVGYGDVVPITTWGKYLLGLSP